MSTDQEIIDNLQSICDGYEKTIQAQDIQRDQLKEKVETLTQQKHSLEQTNIGLKRDLNRAENEIENQIIQIKLLHDTAMISQTNMETAEAELKVMIDRLHKFMDKYI